MEDRLSAGTSPSISANIFRYLPLILTGVWVLLFWPTFADLYGQWIQWDESLAHGLPVAAVFIFLLYKTLPWQPVRQSALVWCGLLVLLALSSLAWYLFRAINIDILEQLVLLPLLAVLLAAVFGPRQVFKHRLLLLFPIFAIPVWEYLNQPLLMLSSTVVGELVRMVRMPALIEGSSIYIPYGHILIADGCSGLRYFVIALTMGYLISYLNRYNEAQMALVLAIAIILGLITNWIRIFVLILVGYQTEMQSSLMEDHEFFGWVLFAIIMGPAIYFAPVVKYREGQASGEVKGRLSGVQTLVPLIILALGPVASLAVDMDPEPGSWQSLLAAEHSQVEPQRMPLPLILPSGGFSEAARLGSEGVYLQVDQYRRESKNDKLVPYARRFHDSDAWQIAQSSDEQLAGHPAAVAVLEQKVSSRRIAQIQWFNTGGFVSSSYAAAKLWQIPAMLTGNNHFHIVTLQARCDLNDCEQALEQLRQSAENLQLEESH